MIFLRTIHNIVLSVLSFAMLVGITLGTWDAGKFASIDTLLCSPYTGTKGYPMAYLATNAFLWSKYLEWLDTLFLQLGGKPISMLQYTHHMTTAFLVWVNFNNGIITPHVFIFEALNCFVHVPMYWYFAYPDGFLKRFRKQITQIQIVQHIICLTTIIYTQFVHKSCAQIPWGNEVGFAMYMMYLVFFMMMYFSDAYNKASTKGGEKKLD